MKHLLMIMAAIALLSSCSTTSSTRAMLYPKMYEEKPRTILVMPPINNTTTPRPKNTSTPR